MGYGILAGVVFLVAVVFLLLSLKLLVNRSWLLGFARGVAGLAAFGLTALLVFTGMDLGKYHALKPDQTVLTVSFRRTSPDHFSVELQETSAGMTTVSIEGQQWQLESRLFLWTPLMKAVGFRTGYQLDVIKGRYLELDRQMKSADQGTSLREPSMMVDVWLYVKDHPGIVPGLEAVMVSPGMIPAADGAIFEVVLSGTELVAKPVNDAAKNAQVSW